MRKKVLSGVFALALVATVGFGVKKSMNGNAKLNDLALTNVEALAQTETSDEFHNYTGCWACICPTSCIGNDGRSYKHASRR